MTGLKTFTAAEVAQHKTENDCWLIIHGQVYDVTSFLNEHPGGKKVVLAAGGTDASKKFDLFHKPSVLQKYGPKLRIGTVGESSPSSSAQPQLSPPAQANKGGPNPESLSKSFSAQKDATEGMKAWDGKNQTSSPKLNSSVSQKLKSTAFGEMVPFGDPSWYQEWYSPYYNEHHLKVRKAAREFVEEHIAPYCHEWDENKKMPKDLFKTFAKHGWLGGVAGAPWLSEYAGDNVCGGAITANQFDVWCELIICDEVSRCGSGGVVWGLFGGLSIGLPPIIKFGHKTLRDRVARPCLTGEKVICLAITEPYAGSDVANIQCTARKSEDGKYYIVNGEKKWITNGVYADFFTVAVRTGGKGASGISLLLIERGPGVTTRQMNCQGVWCSGTTYITFEDVKVPVENLIGKEGSGFKYIMMNFNHERWSICIQAARFARVCLEEALRYSFKRKTFGKLLIEHPVIRLKLAHMSRQVEATWSQIENVTYQMSVMSFAEQSRNLGGPIALLKAQCTQVFEYCAREASQIFGGLAYTRGGQGEKVERLYREVRAYAIPGGSEEIMLDLGIRQSIKQYEKQIGLGSKM